MTLFLTEDELAGVVDLGDLIDSVRALHADLTLGQATQPVPAIIDTAPSTVLLPMVSTSHRLGLTAVKILTDAQGHGSVQQSTVLLLDAATGDRLAVLPGRTCTRMRTAATSAAATDALARGDSRVLGLVGAGPLAVEHVAAVRRVRPIERVVVWSRTRERLSSFRQALQRRDIADGTTPLDVVEAAGIREVVEAADVLCTLTPAREPVVRGEWFRPGQHVNAVGAPPRPDHREIDSAGLARATVVVDSTDVSLAKSGEAVLSIRDGATTADDFRCELGDVLTGLAPGRLGSEQITLFNSVGLALQDLAFGALVLRPVAGTVRVKGG
ncbi:ornithine cyclodeaminase family protein [Actinoplanes bogorensis]|uniref:Ornithine cyclodeaminase family protein n=1 Tax=Paractinoplanes bogorensis TaxID=1610840 RepID=A0ABS5YG62_9ACTN|nr:ornithine cyclodeaminase family protein [Actinoplanes bogorensis]MBU2662469.1 ornithine cyclodeaminase family protein [Actinoplanes bogorensis]